MSKRILLVGESFSGTADYLKTHGFDYIVLKDILRTKYPNKKFKHRVLCDFSSDESILQTIDTLPSIDGVMSVYEHYILPAAKIAAHLGLPGMPLDAARACTDKFLMRGLFAKAPKKISPDFALVDSEADLRAFAKNHEFPLILKPANLSKSLLVTKNDNLDELLQNYQHTASQIQAVYDRYAPHSQPKLLVEEFLQGSIHSVDAFIGQDGEPQVLNYIVDYRTGYDMGYTDNFHYSRVMPSKLSAKDQIALRECAALGAKALDMRSSPAHIEIIMTKDGPRIVEIGARNGGYREWMHGVAQNIDIAGGAIALALGETPDLTATKNEPCAVLELFPKTPGNFAGIAHFDELQKLPSLHDARIKVKDGQFVGKAADGYKMCAIIELHHHDQAQFDKDLSFIDQHVHVQTT